MNFIGHSHIPMEAGTSKVLKYLFKEKFNKFPYADFEYELNSHPDFPTLKSISDTLEKFGIENVPVKLRPDELEKLDTSFLAYINNKGQKELAFVKPKNNGSLEYRSETQDTVEEELSKFFLKFSGIAVLLDLEKAILPTANSEKKKERLISKSIIILASLSFGCFTALSVFNNHNSLFANIFSSLLLVTKAFGLTLATILLLKGFGQSSSLIDKVCKLGKQADCNVVLESRFATIYGWLKWSDLGFIYFLSSWLLLTNGSTGMVALLSVSALPYVFVSLYQQLFLLKKLCPLCLGVLTVLLAEFTISIGAISDLSLTTSEFLKSALVMTALATFYLTAKALFLSIKTKKELEYRYNRLKRIPEVITQVVKRENKLIQPQIPTDSLKFGNLKDDALKVQVFLSLHCGHCGRLFSQLNEHLNKGYKLGIELFLHFDPKNEFHVLFVESLLKRYSMGEVSSVWIELDRWYKKLNSNKFKAQRKEPSEELKKILLSTNHLLLTNQIQTLPKLFVEGFEKSSHYKLNDYLENLEALKNLNTEYHKEMIINT